MTLTEIISISIAVASLVISIWAIIKTNQVSNNDIRLSRRVELHSLMQEIERELIDRPELSLMFKSEQDHKEKFQLPPLPVQEAYVFMHLNLFELAHSIFKETKNISRKESEISEAWDSTIIDFFNNCVPALNIWQEYKLTYYKSFRDYVEKIRIAK